MPFTDPFVANPYPYSFSGTLGATPNVGLEIVENFVSGVYTISWSGGGTLTADFWNGSNYIGTATGTSPLTFNLAQAATKVVFWNTVGSVSVVIALTALLAAAVSGQLYIYSTSQTITITGSAYFVLVGAAGGSAGASGGSGGIVAGRVTLTGSLPLIIGTAGTSAAYNGNANPGGVSTFAGFTAGGGGGASGSTAGAAGSPNGVIGAIGGSTGTATSTAAVISGLGILTMGSTGSGGSGAGGGGVIGGGSGIGTGGTSASTGTGGAASGFGASGGGIQPPATLGGASTGGVLYLLVFA